jgi:hypothetical protein
MAAAALLCTAGASTGGDVRANFLAAPGFGLSLGSLKFVTDAYPEALPNDGRSESTISVQLTGEGGQPLAGVKVAAHVDKGDGYIPRQDAVTDELGSATFTYRVGITPVSSEISVVAVESGIETHVAIPIAPVSYLDISLLDPQEYQKYRDRQTSAAPIYKLDLNVFPDQLAADGGSLAIINATLRMADGKPAPGVPLMAEMLSGDAMVSGKEKATDSSGRMSFYFVAGRVPGTATENIEPSTGLVAAVDVQLVESGPCRIELSYLDPLRSSLSREGAVMPADGITSLPIVAQVTDLFGLPMPGIELRIEALEGQEGWVQVLDPVSDAAGEVVHLPRRHIAGQRGSAPSPRRDEVDICPGRAAWICGSVETAYPCILRNPSTSFSARR